MTAKAHGFTQLRSSALALNAGSSRAQVSGFTLIELMVVVVIMGVLAALATYGVRRYVLEAKKAEAASMITQIRAAEEAYRDETFEYRGCRQVRPVASGERARRPECTAGSTSRTVIDGFWPTRCSAHGSVEYSYCVVAGGVGTHPQHSDDHDLRLSGCRQAPFYIAMAKADLNGDGTFTYALSHSDTSAIHIDNTF